MFPIKPSLGLQSPGGPPFSKELKVHNMNPVKMLITRNMIWMIEEFYPPKAKNNGAEEPNRSHDINSIT